MDVEVKMETPKAVVQGLVSKLEQLWRAGEMEQELGREHSMVRKRSSELVPGRVHERLWKTKRLVEKKKRR